MTRALLEAVRADPAVLVLIESTDPGAFCAGADLSVADSERAVVSDLLYECYEAMITRPGPVIAVVEGPAVGGGAQLAGAADLRIAGPGARFRWSGPPGRDLAVGAWVLPALIGRGAALELTLTGRWVEAAEALRLGLVNRVEEEPGKAAAALAGELLARGTAGTGSVKLITSAGGLLDTVAGRARGEPGGVGRPVTDWTSARAWSRHGWRTHLGATAAGLCLQAFAAGAAA